MSKQKDNSVLDIETPPKKERDYGPRPQDMQGPSGTEIIRDFGKVLDSPKKPRRAAPNIQLSAKIDRLLQEAEEKSPGSYLSILGFLAEGRGHFLESQGE